MDVFFLGSFDLTLQNDHFNTIDGRPENISSPILKTQHLLRFPAVIGAFHCCNFDYMSKDLLIVCVHGTCCCSAFNQLAASSKD